MTIFYGYPPGCSKIGMVSSADLIIKIAEKLKEYHAGAHCGGPGDGGDQRSEADRR